MDEYEVNEVDLTDLVKTMVENVKEDVKDFNDIVNLHSALRREIFIGDIEVGTGSTVDTYIRYWNSQDENVHVEDREPIKLYIDSCGGSLADVFTIIDSIRLSKTPVIGICTGTAYSGGFFILISCDRRYAYPHASFLFHEGATGNSGTSGQFENYTAFYKKELEKLKKVVLTYTKITEEEYATIKREDIWYDTDEALEKGIIDAVAEEYI